MIQKVFLALVGGRSATPTIMGALHFLDQFDQIKFLLCQDKDNKYQDFSKDTIRILRSQKSDILCDEEKDIKVVNGNNFEQVYSAVQELCIRDEIELKFVNVTSSPQEMAFAVFNYVRENHEKALVFNVNTSHSKITPLVLGFESIPLENKLTVEEYISACGSKIHQRKFNLGELSCNEEQAINLVNFFINDIEKVHKILSTIRKNEKIKTPKTIKIKSKEFENIGISDRETIQFFEELKQNKIISKFEFDSNDKAYSYRIEKQSDYAFLYGDWLEYFVYTEGKKIGFDSIEISVELSDYKGEIDVFCVHNANPLICECKTGKYHKNDLIKLENKAEKLGGNYCVRLFITTEQEANEELLGRAKNRKITVVSGKDLKNLATILEKQMNEPDFPRN